MHTPRYYTLDMLLNLSTDCVRISIDSTPNSPVLLSTPINAAFGQCCSTSTAKVLNTFLHLNTVVCDCKTPKRQQQLVPYQEEEVTVVVDHQQHQVVVQIDLGVVRVVMVVVVVRRRRMRACQLQRRWIVRRHLRQK